MVRKKNKISEEKFIECKNCGNRFEGIYCNECGQKHNVNRLTIKSVVENIFVGITTIDRGFLHTLIMLVLHPGEIITNYIQGKRVRYMRPFSLLFIIYAVYGIIISVVNFYFPDISEELLVSKETFVSDSFDFYKDHPVVFSLIELPLMAWAMKIVFGKLLKSKFAYNYTELLFASVFIVCLETMVTIVTVPLKLYVLKIGNDYTLISWLLGVVVTAWCIRGMFNLGFMRSLWKSVLVIITSNFLLAFGIIAIILTLIVIGGVMIFYIPEPIRDVLLNILR
ncbi:MAG: DUF3667 domain-containing protein [Culturomica sp.]|jgi:hypothetical protein|nr:DUF3667 domain-containing protein [Culturomica sp.]